MAPRSLPSSTPPGPQAGNTTSVIPWPTWLRLAWAWLAVAAFGLWGHAWLAAPLAPTTAIVCFAVLFVTIVAASFGVVKEADLLAHRLGEPYGTLILTLSIVLIEVILIASVLLGPGEFPTIGRDSIFAVMMIIVNLVMGLCLVVGGLRHGEQEYNAQGTSAYLSMIMLLTALALVLPNQLSGAGQFSGTQSWAIAGVTALLYAVFLALQMGSQRRLFIQPAPGSMWVPARPGGVVGAAVAAPAAPAASVAPVAQAAPVGHAAPVAPVTSVAPLAAVAPAASRAGLWLSTILLLAMIVPIVLLAHHLAIVIDYGVMTAGAPVALSGLLIAIIVFTPESITAVKAARNDEMQRAINLCLGAFVSTVGLTVPAVLIIGQVTGKTVTMGISGLETVLLVATVLLSLLSFKGQRTSVLQGYMHLVLFLVYGFLLFSH